MLDLARAFMLQAHYNYMKARFPHARLLGTDTDSLFYYIVGNDPLKAMVIDTMGDMYPCKLDFSSALTPEVLARLPKGTEECSKKLKGQTGTF